MGFELTTLVVIGTDCTGGCKSSYHTITTTNRLNGLMSDCCLTPNEKFAQPYHGENKLHFNEMMMMSDL